MEAQGGKEVGDSCSVDGQGGPRGPMILIASYMSDGPGYVGPVGVSVGPHGAQVACVDYEEAGKIEVGSAACEGDLLPGIAEVLEGSDQDAGLIYEHLSVGSREYVSNAEAVELSKTVKVRWDDGSEGAVMIWGDPSYVSAIFFDGKHKGEVVFEMSWRDEKKLDAELVVSALIGPAVWKERLREAVESRRMKLEQGK